MRKVVVFDFDGTLTTKDTLLEFIRYVRGTRALLLGLLKYAPLLVLMKLGLYPNGLAKQRVFAHFFCTMAATSFDYFCRRFARDKHHLLRPEGVKAVEQAQAEGAQVVIISASIDNWVQPFFPGVKVLGTQLELRAQWLTGRFVTNNCYGQEKVNRLLELYPDRENYYLVAYGDSRGDKEMLDFADEAHYKPFR